MHSFERVGAVEEIDLPAVGRLQAPLRRLEHALRRRAEAGEPHLARALRALDREADVYPAVELVHLAADPGDLVPEVDLVAEVVPRLLRMPKRVQCRVYDRAGQLLVVEYCDGARRDDGDEVRERAPPAEACGLYVCKCWYEGEVSKREPACSSLARYTGGRGLRVAEN